MKCEDWIWTTKGSEKQSRGSLIGGDCSSFEISIEVQQYGGVQKKNIEMD